MQPGSNGGFQKVFFGDEEIAIPVYGRYGRQGHQEKPFWRRWMPATTLLPELLASSHNSATSVQQLS